MIPYLSSLFGIPREKNVKILGTGVMPTSGYYGRSFTKILGKTPEINSADICYNKHHRFKVEELVIVTVETPNDGVKTVFGRIIEKKENGKYNVAIKNPDDLSFGFTGYIHLVSSKEIGRIPPTFSEMLSSLERK